jgi:tRNA(Ile)-lysidine synthase
LGQGAKEIIQTATMLLDLEQFKSHWANTFPGIATHNTHFIIAVSGGVDSIVLATLMQQMGAKCSIAHANFQLRGDESNMDERFVQAFATKMDMPFLTKRFDTLVFAEQYKMGIQQAAREIRYAWFESLIKEMDVQAASKIVLLTAHHADDQVETVLMQFFRGTGLHGLTGIPAIRTHQQNPLATDHIDLIRPLLPFSKASIKDFAKLNGLDYVEDSSNVKNDYTRNLIRNQLIPQMETIYPNVNQQVLDTISRLKEAEAIVEATVSAFWKKHIRFPKGIPTIELNSWNQLKGNTTYIWGLVQAYGFKATQLKEIHKIAGATKGAFIASNTHRLIKWDNQIQIVSKQEDKVYETVSKDQLVVDTLFGKFQLEWIENMEELKVDTSATMAYLDADQLSWPLLNRSWVATDYFYPLGMCKKKKLNHFLGNLKLSPAIKAKTTVLCSDSKIVWVVGQRIDERFKITPKTKRVLKITFLSKS